MMSLYITAGNLGLAVGPAALRLGLPTLGPAISLPLAVPCLLIALAVYLVVPARTVSQRRSESFGAILSKHRGILARLLAIATLRSWANVGLATFLPLLLVERGLPVEDGATALAILLFFGGVGGLVAYQSHFARDRRGNIALSWVSVAAPGDGLLGAGRSMAEAWSNLQGQTVPSVAGTARATRLEEARRWLQRADSALRAGDWSGFGTAWDHLREALGPSAPPRADELARPRGED